MKNLKKIKKNKILAAALALLLLTLIVTPFPLAAGECEGALGACLVDAIIAGLFGGIQTLLAYSAFCGIGYGWCLRYYSQA